MDNSDAIRGDESPIPIFVVIPALQPDDRLVLLTENLVTETGIDVLVVDDGSGPEYAPVFDRVRKTGGTVISHAVNLGKGRALKTAFNFLLTEHPETVGCVTADADGQHLVEDIVAVADRLREEPNSLVLGVRDFSDDMVPAKSRIGNTVTRRAFSLLCGVSVTDTQTGLRGIPRSLMTNCLTLDGERFEFEMEMLASCRGRFGIVEVPIATVYDSKDDHASHYRPFADSVPIAKVIAKSATRHAMSSISTGPSRVIRRYMRDEGGIA